MVKRESMNQQTKTYVLGALGLVLVIGLIWWGQARREEVKDSIRIGVLMPLSAGTGSFYGQYGRRGLELAQEKINAEGGINGSNLQLVYENSEGKPRVGVQAITKLLNEEIRVFIGDQISGVTLAVAPIVEENKALLIVPGSASPKVSEAGDYIFRTKVSANIESKTAAQFIAQDLGAKRVAFLYQNSDYGVGVFAALKTDATQAGMQIVAEELFDIGATDVRSQLAKLKNSAAEYILVAAYPQETGVIMRQAKELGVQQKFFVHSGSIGPDTIKEAGAAADGLLFLYEIRLDTSREETDEFIKRYREKYGEQPELFSSLAYDTLLLLADKARTCSTDTECLKGALYQTRDFAGVTGVIGFDSNGDIVRNDFTPMTIIGGQFVRYDQPN